MKHTIITRSLAVGLLSLSSFSALRAQDSRFEVGVNGGLTLSTVRQSGSNTSGLATKSIAGGIGGVTLQYNISPIFSVLVNPAFETKGALQEAKGNFFGFAYDVSVKEKLSYFTVPLMLRASFGERVRFFANAGVYAGYLLKDTYELKDNVNKTSETGNADSTTKKGDFGLSGGLGVAVPVGDKFAISFEARENLGLMDIVKSSGQSQPGQTTPTVKNNSVNFLFGIAYRFGGR